jgi:signal-transduction protein with cAMP-binding, CBS, and nucleotidyltransferase domain
MDTGIKVGDCMKTSLVTIDENASVYEAAELMTKKGVGSLLVEKKGKVYGLVTDADLVRKCVAKRKMDLKVKNVASKPLVTIAPTVDLADAARMMGLKRIKRLVVVKDGRVSGIISETDIVQISPSLYDLIVERDRVTR